MSANPAPQALRARDTAAPAAAESVAEDPVARRRALLRITLIGYAAWLFVFELVGRFASTLSTRDVTLELDRRIPFWPAMIWAYELCYLLPLVPALVIRDRHRFNRMLLAFLLANVVALAVYLVLPVDFSQPVPGADLSGRLVALEYAVDFQPGANHLPSLHVVVAWLVFAACLGAARWTAPLLFVAAAGISVATLFVKQHVVLDVLGGMVLALGAWIIAGRLYHRLTEGADAAEALPRVLRRAGIPSLIAIGLMLLGRAMLRPVWP